MGTRGLPYHVAPAPARRLAAATLRAASLWLGRLATRLVKARRPAAPAEPVCEFHAEAGAPEGALFVDGRLVGHLPGANRL